MRAKETIRIFVGAVMVYVAIAACGAGSGGGGGNGSTALNDGGGSGSNGGDSSGSGPGKGDSSGGGTLDAFMDAIADALVDPVKDANAGPLPPIVATEACDKAFTTGPGGSFAVHAFPGKLVNDLGALQVITHAVGSSLKGTLGGQTYEHYTGAHSIYLRDGSAAVACYNAADTITFILPQ